MGESSRWVGVAKLVDIPKGEMLGLTIEGQKVALYHLESGELYATANICTHEYALLSDGWLEGCEVECPLHGGRFDLRDGKALCAPAERELATFKVRLDDGVIHLALPEAVP